MAPTQVYGTNTSMAPIQRQRKIIIKVLTFGIIMGLLFVTRQFKPAGFNALLTLLVFPFCIIAWYIGLKTGICSIKFDFYDKIGFLLIQSLVYLVIGYLISKTRKRKN